MRHRKHGAVRSRSANSADYDYPRPVQHDAVLTNIGTTPSAWLHPAEKPGGVRFQAEMPCTIFIREGDVVNFLPYLTSYCSGGLYIRGSWIQLPIPPKVRLNTIRVRAPRVGREIGRSASGLGWHEERGIVSCKRTVVHQRRHYVRFILKRSASASSPPRPTPRDVLPAAPGVAARETQNGKKKK